MRYSFRLFAAESMGSETVSVRQIIDSREQTAKKICGLYRYRRQKFPQNQRRDSRVPCRSIFGEFLHLSPGDKQWQFFKQFLQIPIADRPTLIIILQISLLNEPRRRKEREGREERAFSHFQV
jgi:hypothetical protein